MAGMGPEMWLGKAVLVTLREPQGYQIRGVIADVIPQQSLTIVQAVSTGNGQTHHLPRVDVAPSNIADLKLLQTAAPPISVPDRAVASPSSNLPTPTGPRPATDATPTTAIATKPPAFHDPAILSLGRPPAPLDSKGSSSKSHEKLDRLPRTTQPPPIVLNPADRITYDSPDETDTATIAGPQPNGEIDTGLKVFDTTEDNAETNDLSFAQPASSKKASRARPRRKKGPGKPGDDDGAATAASPAGVTQHGKGWRQTPILQSNKEFENIQPFTHAKKSRKRGNDPTDGWASEDVTDVQGAGDFDFEGSLAKFDKKTVFDQLRQDDQVSEAERLVSHNRVPKPKPGTAGGKNFHYSENVLDLTSPATKPGGALDDFWKSEADDGRHDGEQLSGRDNSGRNSRLRNESRVSATRRSQSRKASGTTSVGGGGHMRAHPGIPGATGLYTLTSNRRIDTVTHLQMLVVENVASNDFGLSEELMSENAGRGIAEVVLKSLNDPAIRLQFAAASPGLTPTIVILAGNHKSGTRAIAAARHLKNRGITVLVCAVGLDRESELLDDFRKQLRLFRQFGGVVCAKAELFDHLSKNTTTLNSSAQVNVSLIIDALLGLTISFEELRKSDQATTYELMEWANRNKAFVMAIDVPSGIDPSSGKVNIIDGAQLYVRPRYVIALGAPKQGLLKALEDGVSDDWNLHLADIGLGTAIWRKTSTKIRRGIEFEHGWTMELRFQGLDDD